MGQPRSRGGADGRRPAGPGLRGLGTARERANAADAILPLARLRSRQCSWLLFFASLYGSAFFLPQFLQTALGYGPLGAGLRLLPWTAMLFVSAPLAGALINRFGERPLMVGALLLQAVALAWMALIARPGLAYSAALAWMALIARPGLAYSALVAPLIVAGFGVAAIPASQNAVVSSVAANEIGNASGAFNMLRQLGAAFGVAILAAVFAAVGSFGSAQAFGDGFAPAMGVSAALSLVGAAAGMGLPSRRAKAFVVGLSASLLAGAVVLALGTVGVLLLVTKAGTRDLGTGKEAERA